MPFVPIFRARYGVSTLLFFWVAVTFAQTPRNRYLAYGSYVDPSTTAPSDEQIILAANASGQVCAEDQYYLLLINPDGTLVYSETIASLKTIKSRGSLLGIAIDAAGDCYLAGQGEITPTPGAYQNNKELGLYVVKFDSSGNTVFATYEGGSGYEYPSGIALDPGGNVWLAGTTNSNDFPVTSNAIQPILGGGSDAFITELNPTGTKLLYGTYLGGSNNENVTNYHPVGGIAIDSGGNVYVSGSTLSSKFPVFNALQPTLLDESDPFITKISNTGTLIYSTYLGDGWSTGIAADSAGNAFLTGIGTVPQVGPSLGTSDAFVSKLNPGGSALVYSSQYGQCVGCVLTIQSDLQGNLSIGGPAPPQLVNPIQTTPTESGIADVDPNGNLIFGTYLGSAGGGFLTVSLGIDSDGNLYAGTIANYLYSPPLLRPFYGTFEPDQGDDFNSGAEPFISKVALGTGASFAVPTTVQYPAATVGNSGMAPTIVVTLFDTGTTDIDISNITANGPDFVIQQNQCPAMLNAGTQCDVSVTFIPTEGGIRTNTLVVDDDSPGNPHTIQLTGLALVAGLAVSPTSLTFPVQALQTMSAAQNVSLTAGQTVSINQIAISGTNAGDFTESNTCGASLGSGQSCKISVTFSPTALGSRVAAVSITTNLGIQTVPLTGTGVAGLGLGIPAGGSNSATITPGSTAKYTLAIGGGGLSGSATLACTGAPTGSTCTLPGSVSVSATQASQFTVSVSTTALGSAALWHEHSPSAWFLATALLGMLCLPAGGRSRRLASKGAALLPLLLITFLISCGGGNSGGGGSGGTPAGTYNLTVTATMGSTKQSQVLKLTVN